VTVAPRTRVRNVVFDFGGVLVSWRPQEIIDTFYAEPHLREALRLHAFQHDDWFDMDRGTLDEASVVRRCAARMARPDRRPPASSRSTAARAVTASRVATATTGSPAATART